jgi:hypothetical protein
MRWQPILVKKEGVVLAYSRFYMDGLLSTPKLLYCLAPYAEQKRISMRLSKVYSQGGHQYIKTIF